MISRGKVQVVVASRRAPTRTVSISQPIYTMSGIRIGSRNDLRVVYGSELDQEHERAIEEGRKLANRLGLELEVIDESKSGLLGRMFSSIGRGRPGHPSVVVSLAPSRGTSGLSMSSDPMLSEAV